MNIWVIGRSYPTPKNRMCGSFELEQAKMLANHGHHVTYMAAVLHPFKYIKKWGIAHFQDENVQIYTDSVFFAPERMHMHPAGILESMWKKLFAAAEREQGVPDIIHIHYPGMNGFPSTVAAYKEKGVRIVTTEHWTKVLTDSMDTFQRKQLIEFSQLADEILCVGEPLKKAIREITHTNKNITVVPNIVSDLFQPAPDKDAKGTFHFIAVGRLVPVKQMDLLAETFAKTFKDSPNVVLDIVGGGSERKKIEAIIREHGASNQIFLNGTLSREETAQKVAQSDCLICFSRLETFGVPVIEAWACGIPAIGTDALGFMEYFNDNLGYIVPHNDTGALSNAMKDVLTKSFDCKYIHDFAIKRFGEDAVYDRLLQIYRSSCLTV